MSTDQQSPGAAGAGAYTPNEVAYLLGLSREDAVYADAVPRSSADLNGNESSASALAYDDASLSTLVRWTEVQQARRRVIVRRLADEGADRRAVLQHLTAAYLRATGMPAQAVGDMVGLSEATAHRRFTGLLADVLAELGGEAPPVPDRLDASPSACLRCGAAPRVRSSRTRRVKSGGRRETVTTDRLTSLCEGCLQLRATESASAAV